MVSRAYRILLVLLFSSALNADEGVGIISEDDSGTGHFRVCWNDDPSTKATIGWTQFEGAPGKVHFGKEDQRRRHHLYEEVEKPSRVQVYDEMRQCFVRLEGLEPDTQYFFCIKDDLGVSRRLKFRTAPSEPKEFTFASGGDSRNHRDARVRANRICRQLRPLFIAFTGDMISGDNARNWTEWLDDWQETIGEDGNIIPIVAHRGNHEKRPETIHCYFDTPQDAYFAFNVGGSLLRYYTLNSEIPANGAQGKWLEDDLTSHRDEVTHLIAGYHKPMRPHVSAKSEGDNSYLWAATFYENGLDLALESDSHVIKWTQPLKPDPKGDEGFSPALSDPKATVFIGEGCWGAPLRAADDAKPWTIDLASFNGFDWIRVMPDGIEVRTVQVDKTKGPETVDSTRPFEIPKGLKLWNSKGGHVLRITAD